MSSVRRMSLSWLELACSAWLALTAGCGSPDPESTGGDGGSGGSGGSGGAVTSSAPNGGTGGGATSSTADGGSSGSAGNTIESVNGGTSYIVADAISYLVPDPYGRAAIILSDRGDLCERLNLGHYYFDEHLLRINLFTKVGNEAFAPTEPGTFVHALGDGAKADINFQHVTAMCSLAGSGTELDVSSITLESIDADNEVYSGHGDLLLADGNHVLVSFHPQGCEVQLPGGFDCQ